LHAYSGAFSLRSVTADYQDEIAAVQERGSMAAQEVSMDCRPVSDSGDGCPERELQPLIESLLAVLKTEIDVQRELRHTLEEEHRFLRISDANQLLKNNVTKERLLLKAMTLEDGIAAILKNISRLNAFPGERLTLSALSSVVAPPLQEELRTCRNILTPLVKENRDLNEGNRDVLDTLIRLVNNSMRIITNAMTADSGYLGTGARNPALMTGAVLCLKG
jgi:hypothetical protein